MLREILVPAIVITFTHTCVKRVTRAKYGGLQNEFFEFLNTSWPRRTADFMSVTRVLLTCAECRRYFAMCEGKDTLRCG
jgi:hypothetical protein